MNRYITAAAAAALIAAATLAAGQTLYKLIDKNGKVTYSESPPKDFPGQVIRIDIDPNRNTATLPKLKESAPRESGGSAPATDPVATARQRLEAAKKALADAEQNPGDSDLTFIGNKGGGTRPVPTDAYAAKLAGLEAEVKAAEEALRRAESR